MFLVRIEEGSARIYPHFVSALCQLWRDGTSRRAPRAFDRILSYSCHYHSSRTNCRADLNLTSFHFFLSLCKDPDMSEKQSNPNNEMKRVSSLHASAVQLDLIHDVIARSGPKFNDLPRELARRSVIEKLWQYIVFLNYLLTCTIRRHLRFMAKCKVRSISRCIDIVDNNSHPHLGVFFR